MVILLNLFGITSVAIRFLRETCLATHLLQVLAYTFSKRFQREAFILIFNSNQSVNNCAVRVYCSRELLISRLFRTIADAITMRMRSSFTFLYFSLCCAAASFCDINRCKLNTFASKHDV